MSELSSLTNMNGLRIFPVAVGRAVLPAACVPFPDVYQSNAFLPIYAFSLYTEFKQIYQFIT
jgi:hypothetical protein